MTATKQISESTEQQAEQKPKKSFSDYILWIWVVLLCVAGIYMAIKFIGG